MKKEIGHNIKGERIFLGDKDRAAENHEFSTLLDVYGGLLSDKNYEVMRMYYSDDLSLAEIAEQAGMTRQGTFANLKSCRQKLRQCEEKLGLIKRNEEMQRDFAYIMKRLDTLAKEGVEVHDIIGRVKKILEL
ncbi:MAG: DNA-binding protein [Oscillospiraceae bacterium]|nr:DNA-binding protein [Oscillospiraceae bacterium]